MHLKINILSKRSPAGMEATTQEEIPPWTAILVIKRDEIIFSSYFHINKLHAWDDVTKYLLNFIGWLPKGSV